MILAVVLKAVVNTESGMIALPRELELVLPRMAGVDLPGDQARMACRVALAEPLGLGNSVRLMLSYLRCRPNE